MNTSKQILVIQHTPEETPGIVSQMMADRNLSVKTFHPWKDGILPQDLSPFDALLVMGGPMGVYESGRFPYLNREQEIIQTMIEANKPVAGVCLGSQLIASVLGAKVAPSPRMEIGWYRVELSQQALTSPFFKEVPSDFMAFHWHGDQFELPREATPLASSAITPCQAFSFGKKTLALLFHLEVTEDLVKQMTQDFPEDVTKGGESIEEIIAGIKTNLAPLHGIARQVFGTWLDLL